MKMKIYLISVLVLNSISILNAQNYLISFTGSGAISKVEMVKIENLMQGTNLTLSGNDILHLVGTITGIESGRAFIKTGISFSPNPMKDYCLMEFTLPESGKTEISFYDLTCKKLIREEYFLPQGKHIYRIKGVGKGFYLAVVKCGKFLYSSRLISSESNASKIQIIHENSIGVYEKQTEVKGTNADHFMQFNDGDRLKFTAITDLYSTIIVEVPMESKTITFEFIACTDGDGNNYPVVKIGDQIWMAENLKTTKYYDGTDIPNITESSLWTSLTKPAFCWYDNDLGNKSIYGALYNWYSVNTDKLCPAGWHVPSDTEWTSLLAYLGGESIAGLKLKETGITYWANPNLGVTNETGFSARPGGYRYVDGKFHYVKQYGDWWSSTEASYERVWYRNMHYYVSAVYRDRSYKNNGFSVRCIKNLPKN